MAQQNKANFSTENSPTYSKIGAYLLFKDM